MQPLTFDMLARRLRDAGIDPDGMTYREARRACDALVTDEQRATVESMLNRICGPPDEKGRRRVTDLGKLLG